MQIEQPQLPFEELQPDISVNTETAATQLEVSSRIPMWRHRELKGPVTMRELREAWVGLTPDEIDRQRAINEAGIASVRAAMKQGR